MYLRELKIWTPSEEKRLKELFLKQFNSKEIFEMRALPGRTEQAIRLRMQRLGLRVRKNVQRPYNTDEDDFLKKNYGRMRVSIIARHLQRTKCSVIGRAHRLGLSRTKW